MLKLNTEQNWFTHVINFTPGRYRGIGN